jgi:O-antigen/teichoic acid export membrane protein
MSDVASEEPPLSLALLRPSRHLAVDLGTSYALSLSRVAAAAVVVGILYRYTTPEFVAVFVLARSMLSGANLLFSGTGPATLIELNRADRTALEPQWAQPLEEERDLADDGPVQLDYATPKKPEPPPRVPLSLHTHAFTAAGLCGLGAMVIVLGYAFFFADIHRLGPTKLGGAAGLFVAWFALGLLFRVTSDPAGAALQRRGRLSLDNLVQIIGEAAWIWFAFGAIQYRYTSTLIDIGAGYAFSGFLVWVLRVALAPRGPYLFYAEIGQMLRRWFAAASMIALGSLADLLYGSASVLIINQFLSRTTLAAYAPAMQIDAALLLGVGAISAVLLPRATKAAATHDWTTLRRIYVASLIASVAILAIGSIVVLTFQATLIEAWLGTLPAETVAILPLVLVHTVIGGSAGVGRAMLIAMGRFRAYVTSAVVFGLLNVFLALSFVLGPGLGLRGIVYATIIAVTLRCAIWMPWYILKTLRDPVVTVPSPGTPGEG